MTGTSPLVAPAETARLETARCLLVPLGETDRQDLRRLYANADVRQFLGGTVEGPDFEDSFKRLVAASMSAKWVIRTRGANLFVGMASIDGHHDGLDQEISYQIMPEFWGRGLGAEVIGRALDHADAALHLPRIVAETQSTNIRSRRLLEQLGMTVARALVRFGTEQVLYSKAFQGNGMGLSPRAEPPSPPLKIKG